MLIAGIITPGEPVTTGTPPHIVTLRQVRGASVGGGLPVAAVGPLSRILGRDEAGYHITGAGGDLLAHNRAQLLTAKFSPAGVLVRTAHIAVRIRLAGYYYGNHRVPVRPVAPRAAANRVAYRDGPLTQWYVNGPAGLEQGFTVREPPARRGQPAKRSPLALALAVTGHARLAPGHGGVVFHRAGAALAYRDLTAHDARGRALRAWLSLAHGRILLHVDTAGARYPLTVDPVFQQLAKLTASDGAANDNLGSSVAISGNTVAVGAPSATVGSSGGQGAVYVFTEPGGGWADETQAAKLTASDGAAGDSLGRSVAISGDTVVAGAPSATVGSNSEQGAAYVFTEPGGGWADETQAAKLTASDGAAFDSLGATLGMSGNTVVAGVQNATIGSNSGQGAAYVFTEPGGGWASETQAAKLTASDGGANDNLGQTVAISGNTVAAGAPSSAVGSTSGVGVVYVFTEPGGGWADETQAAKLTASDGVTNELVGSAVGISGNTVVAGAPNAAIGSNGDQGAVYVFIEPGGGWADETEVAKLTAADGGVLDSLGFSAAISAGTVVAGAPYAAIGSNDQQGAAYVFGSPPPTPPPPGGYRLAGFFSPRRGSRHRARSAVTVATYVDYASGAPIPGWLAAQFAAGCQVSIVATGAQRLHRHCLRWNAVSHDLTYRWKLGARTGKAVLQLSLRGVSSSTNAQISIVPRRHGRVRRHHRRAGHHREVGAFPRSRVRNDL
jgi:hypothetical protein